MDEQQIQTYVELMQALLAYPNEDVSHLLEENLDKFDGAFAHLLPELVTQMIAQQPNAKTDIIAVVEKISNYVVDVPLGNVAENKEIALTGYQIVLRDCEEGTEKWAQTLSHLGNAYLKRIGGQKSENLKKAITACQTALTILTPESSPQAWAMTQHYLGTAYWDLASLHNPEENLQKAIIALNQALTIRTLEAFPQDWAKTQNNLGLVYWRFASVADKPQNLEKAITAYQETLKVLTQENFPQDWARSQNNLGLAYYNLASIKEKEKNLRQAIDAYENALKIYTPTTFPEYWVATQINLGNAYENLSPVASKKENLHKAIIAYENALTICIPTIFSQLWTITQYNLGCTYNELASLREKGKNLENAVIAYKKALTIYTPEDFPQEWAMTQHNLGCTYYYLASLREKGENLENAVTAYKKALTIYTPEGFPQEWATVQNSLGAAYGGLASLREKKKNLENAIVAYKKSLTIRTLDGFSQEWAMTQNNLGSAYIELASLQEKGENLENAVTAYKKALTICTPEDFPQEWATIQNNLGVAYRELASLREKKKNLENAIVAHKKALTIRTLDGFPQEWAMTQNNLGSAYIELASLREKKKNLEKAIATYKTALLISSDNFPLDWARTQNNLGVAYDELASLQQTENNVQKAINAYEAALAIYTSETLPLDCLRTARNLGDLGFTQGDWQLAIKTYTKAIEAVEQSRNWATTPERRQAIIEESIGIYEKMVQACINAERYDLALQTVERSRSKRLVDLMASNDLYKGGEMPQALRDLLTEYEDLQQQIDAILFSRQQNSNGRTLIGEGQTTTRTRAIYDIENQEIQELQTQRADVWEKIHTLQPEFAEQLEVKPLDLEQFSALLKGHPHTALLSFYTTETDTHIFLLLPGEGQKVKVHTCEDQGLETLQDWLNETWLQPYLQNRNTWAKAIPTVLAELTQRLQINELINQYLQDIKELIIIPHLYLHQIPFAALPIDGEKNYLSERFRLRILPSCQILKFCQDRDPIPTPQYGIVANATEDLPCAEYEGQKVATLYNVKKPLQRENATIDNYRTLLKETNSILSSHHAVSYLLKPLESRLILADGSITLGQLMSPGWRLPHLNEIFLSCCETGLGQVESLTDDIFTLSTGFLCAGARSVISSLWAVDDLATALLSGFYHELRKEGLDRPTALQQAQVKLRTSTGKDLKKELTAIKAHLTQIEDQKTKQRNALEEAIAQTEDETEKATLEETLKEVKAVLLKIQGRDATPEREGIEGMQEKIEKILKNRKDTPFAEEQYWAAFNCQGLA